MISRVCVKNLPKNLSEKQLEQHFEEYGPFTDVKIMRTEKGVSRGFGFLGLKDGSKGAAAIQYFNKSFIGMRQITVEAARKVGDASLSRPWSKYSKGSSSYALLNPEDRLQVQKVSKSPSTAEEGIVQGRSTETSTWLVFVFRGGSRAEGIFRLDNEFDIEDETNESEDRKRKRDQHPESDTSNSLRTARLFIRNLPYSATESDLVDAFSRYGEIVEAHLVVDKTTRKSKGLGFVEFEEVSQASDAIKEMDGSIFQGRLIHILPSFDKRKKARDFKAEGTEQTSYKKEKEESLKQNIGDRSTWNTFYMRPDTVTEAVAEYYGLSKSALMDRDASDLGVRLALGETHVIAKTKESLEQAGVDVSKLEAAAEASGKAALKKTIPRSDTIIILKNLPYHSNEGELKEMFARFGTIQRFVMPFTRVMAIAQFEEASSAKEAFRSLAYKKYKNVPLFLEWAPMDLISKPSLASSQHTEVLEDVEEGGVTLYVKNLSFGTKDSDLTKHFDRSASEIGGQLRSARVARRKDSDGNVLSAGYGFVELSSEEVAKHVLNSLQGSVLDGHILQIRRSSKKPKEINRNDDTEELASTKLVVKNLAFECTSRDVTTLFSTYGQISSCRLPKKFDGSHRGFAFVEFITKEQAKLAMQSVAGTHLYGRRLVVEFAKQED